MEKKTIISSLAAALELTPAEIDNIPDEALLAEYGMDSLRFIQMIVMIEEELGIEILDSDLLFENFASKHVMYATIEKYFEK